MDLMVDPIEEVHREIWEGGEATEATLSSSPFCLLRHPSVVYYASASPGTCGLLSVLMCVADAGGLLRPVEVCWAYSE